MTQQPEIRNSGGQFIKILALIVLIVIAAAVGLRPVIQQMQQRREAAPVVRQVQPSSGGGSSQADLPRDPSAPPPRVQIVQGPILADGSVNPVLGEQLPLDAAPNDRLGQMDWREHYAALLAQARPRGDGPAVYVYPFQDLSPRGVGPHMTAGAMYAWTAALAMWTNAQLKNFDPPEIMGFTDALAPPSAQTREVRLARIRKELGARVADYVLTGFYTQGETEGQVALTVVLLDEKNGGRMIEVARDPGVADGNTIELGRQQARAMNAAMQRLPEWGFNVTRSLALDPPLDMEREIREIIQMLSIDDSHATMEAIDRALQLATLAPDRSEPLQAAAYGYAQLAYVKFSFVYHTSYFMDYMMKSWALAQVALTIDDKPLMTRLVWLLGLNVYGSPSGEIVAALAESPQDRAIEELFPLYDWIEDRHHFEYDLRTQRLFPTWLMFRLHRRKADYLGTTKSSMIPYIRDRAMGNTRQDFNLEAYLRYVRDWEYNPANQANYFGYKIRASALAAYWTLAELAAYELIFEKDPLQRALLYEKIAGLAGMDVEELRPLAESGEFYTIRESLWQAWRDAPDFRTSYKSFLLLLGPLTDAAERLGRDTRTGTPASMMTGLEFTPHERLRYAQRRDGLGPALAIAFEGSNFGSYDMVKEMAMPYLRVRPDHAQVLLSVARYSEKWHAEPGGVELLTDSLARGYDAMPLDFEFLTLRTDELLLRGRRADAFRCVRNMVRRNRFNGFIWMYVGEFYDKAGARRLAAEAYERAIVSFPERHDIANRRAWNLCAMGQWEDPEIRKTFEAGRNRYTLNWDFQADYLNYLIDWAKDYGEARTAAEFFCKTHPDWGPMWLARIELLDGNREKGLEIIKNAQPKPDQRGLSLAVYHAEKARILINEFGELDLAKEYVDKAARIDAWQGTVINTMAIYEYARENWSEALAHYRRAAARYGRSMSNAMGEYACLYAMGDRDAARELLEEYVLNPAFTAEGPAYAAYLMEQYAEEGEKDKAAALLDWVLESCHPGRGQLLGILESYKRLDEPRATELTERIDEIMAGPTMAELAERE